VKAVVGCPFNLTLKYKQLIYRHIFRQHIWFSGTCFFGYEDVGDGPGKNPAKHVMMLMVTSLNMGWKLPIAYFLLPDSFPSQRRAELIRQCIQKLNTTGAIVTNIVMDNCALNYATFRFLGCKLSRSYNELDTCTDIKNNLSQYVMALFDPPHLAKLGKFLQIQHNFLAKRFK
jgi:hypothetical protein